VGSNQKRKGANFQIRGKPSSRCTKNSRKAQRETTQLMMMKEKKGLLTVPKRIDGSSERREVATFFSLGGGKRVGPWILVRNWGEIFMAALEGHLFLLGEGSEAEKGTF